MTHVIGPREPIRSEQHETLKIPVGISGTFQESPGVHSRTYLIL